MKKFRKSTIISLALLVYVTATAAYFLPRNTEISITEKYVTVGIAYVVVVLAWLVMRQKEAMQRKRKEQEGKDIH
ncbi:MAG: hypothetical protein LBM62_03365 [Mediterranea sp.]|jgi:membrane protein DedA with SNARE-associated domain|nr:hypothetical protein [Mediterranea sp.]